MLKHLQNVYVQGSHLFLRSLLDIVSKQVCAQRPDDNHHNIHRNALLFFAYFSPYLSSKPPKDTKSPFQRPSHFQISKWTIDCQLCFCFTVFPRFLIIFHFPLRSWRQVADSASWPWGGRTLVAEAAQSFGVLMCFVALTFAKN